MSITISITIPNQLEQSLKDSSGLLGISRSRHIGNILLNWQEQQLKEKKSNDCIRKDHASICSEYNHKCVATQSDAEDCPDYGVPK
jgi:hypothetical protein